MTTRNDELEHFKTEISLSELMASFGYELDRKSSSRSSAAMVHPDGDKLVVARGHDGHWVYFSVRDHTDNGTAIDFVQRRTGENLGHVRRRLRDWMRSPTPPVRPAPESYAQALEPITRDLMLVRTRFAAMELLGAYSPYLVEERRIPMELLAQERFSGLIRRDERGNVVFPHYNRDGLCGYEVKNSGFTGFAKGGVKGLWGSRKDDQDEKLVIAETAIDALSYAVLSGHHRTRFVSVAGELNTDQPALLASAIQRLPAESMVVMALDNDEGGDQLSRKITDAYAASGRIDVALIDDRPSFRGADWNDVLRTSTPPPPSAAPG